LYRVVNAKDAITTIDDVGEEIRRLHRTRKGAQEALDGMFWDDAWGEKPVLEVAEVDAFRTLAAARAGWWQVVQ
jgi:hypothetical protein